MTAKISRVSKYFADKPNFEFVCPTCEKGLLAPDKSSFVVTEPTYSKSAKKDEEWDPDWITLRFNLTCECNRKSCGEISHVSGSGQLDQRYDGLDQSEWYNSFCIRSFFPAPNLIQIPKGAPKNVVSLLKKSFALYWVDVAAAANALRASLEALLDELQVPETQKNAKGETIRLNLHRRIEIWSKQQNEYAELCFALKEVGNLGSHGESVSDKHFFGALEIYCHVLFQLFDNDAGKMKALAIKITSEIKKKKSK